MKHLLATAAVTFAVLGSSAEAITYNVDLRIGEGTVVGTIETLSTGQVGVGNPILSYSLTLWAPNLNGGSPAFIDQGSAPVFSTEGTFASDTELTFFPSLPGFLAFQNGPVYLAFNGTGPGSIYDDTDFSTMSMGCPNFTCDFRNWSQRESLTGPIVIGTVGPVQPIPLPASLPLLAGAILGAGALRRAKRRC